MIRLALLAVLILPTSAYGWSACGHHIVCRIAFAELASSEQEKLLELLKSHPRYEQDFVVPKGVKDARLYRIGYAGEWPDRARDTDFDRPTWHYQLGASVVLDDKLDDKSKLDVPKPSLHLPRDAKMQTQELHAVQAVELCVRVLKDASNPKSERALAASWLAHLTGDLHQPCHAGSLFAEGVFPESDRGANEIETRQFGNLHRLWDRLLGGQFDEADIRRRMAGVIATGKELSKTIPEGDWWKRYHPQNWLHESRRFAVIGTYTNEVLSHVRAVQEGKIEKMPIVDLSPEYLRRAGALAKLRVYQAGQRLAVLWRAGLAE